MSETPTEVSYIAHATATGGRHGHVKTDNGTLSFALSSPGTAEVKAGATNPEELFACAYAACFGSSLEFAAEQQRVALEDHDVHADIALNENSRGFFISATLHINLPRLEKGLAEKLVEDAHRICPYSKATEGNIEVEFKINSLSRAAAA